MEKVCSVSPITCRSPTTTRGPIFLNRFNQGAAPTWISRITAPRQPGSYRLELDLVWEGVMWFKNIGKPNHDS